MTKDATTVFTGRLKAQLCLLVLCLGLGGMIDHSTAARVPDGITIAEGTALPSFVTIGQEIVFSARYSAFPDTGNYSLHACKTRKIGADGSCPGGSWCDSPTPGVSNPASCSYKAAAAGSSLGYSLFVCSSTGICSAPFSGTFSVGEDILDLSAPQTLAFAGVPFSFSGQKSAGNALGDLVLTSNNMSGAGWSLDVTAVDWTDTNGSLLDVDGDGANSGQLTVDLQGLFLESADPASLAAVTRGVTASFSPQTHIINIATAQSGSTGIFVIKGITLDQFIPGGQKEGDYKTVVTFTIS